jgi:hypothetical protein
MIIVFTLLIYFIITADFIRLPGIGSYPIKALNVVLKVTKKPFEIFFTLLFSSMMHVSKGLKFAYQSTGAGLRVVPFIGSILSIPYEVAAVCFRIIGVFFDFSKNFTKIGTQTGTEFMSSALDMMEAATSYFDKIGSSQSVHI